jgi:hypothetical protein
MRKYSLLTLVGSAALFLSSCLKDKNIEDRVYGMEGISDVKLVEFPHSPEEVLGLTFSANDTTFHLLTIRLNSDQPASQDIKVTLVPNNTLVTSAGYTVAPSSIYTLDNLTVTIPAGSREGHLTIKTKPSAIAQGAYAFGFSIGSVSDPNVVISENYKNMLVVLTVKNKYDGRYRLTGFHSRPGLDAPYNQEVHLVTTASNKVKMFWPALGGDAHPINGNTYYSNFTTEFEFNASDKLVRVDNPYTPGSPVFTIGPATDSRYDPTTKTIYAQYYYNNNLQRMFTDTLKYIGVR